MNKRANRRKLRRRRKSRKGPGLLARILKRLGIFLLILFLVLGLLSILFNWITKVNPPTPKEDTALKLDRVNVGENHYKIGDNWLRKNDSGLWEMYTEGDAFELGVINGKLAKELVQEQELHFVNQMKQMVPSPFYIRFLKYLIGWFNRDLDEFIPEEYQLEIYGVSQSASTEYDFIAPNYQRILNYHAAHDIGHALQNMALVGCTSFAAWDEKTEDTTLIIARNFDFFVGEEFAENKIVSFVAPDNGHKFMMITWGGMIGVVSGMNEHGLTVTLNAAKSEVPAKAATPISILGRKILQYAKTIEEAYSIAEKHETFVNESLMIGSAKDKKAVIIEKTTTQIGIYDPKRNYIACSNHFQSETFESDDLNKQNIAESDSKDRLSRVKKLIRREPQINEKEAADILRDQEGNTDKEMGMGNEMAINQLIAHHSVIFKPEQRLVWVSTAPYQLGKFVAYNLDEVFADTFQLNKETPIAIDSLVIPVDNFLLSNEFQNFKQYKLLKKDLKQAIKTKKELPKDFDRQFIMLNSGLYLTYAMLGDYYTAMDDCKTAKKYYEQALSKAIPKKSDEDRLKTGIEECDTE